MFISLKFPQVPMHKVPISSHKFPQVPISSHARRSVRRKHGAWSMHAHTEHGARSTEHGARSTEHGARSTEHGARSTEHGARSMEHGARSTEHRACTHGAWSMTQTAYKSNNFVPKCLRDKFQQHTVFHFRILLNTTPNNKTELHKNDDMNK